MSSLNTSNNSNQQTLAESGANARPLMLEKGNYILWESRFRRFLENQVEEGERMWHSIHGPYQRPMVPNPANPQEDILEPLSKMTEGDKKKYIVDVKLMDEFDKFAAKEGESLESMYERLTTLVNIMDRNNVRPIIVAINTKFLNCLRPEWSKYVTMVHQNQSHKVVSYDELAKKAAKNHDPLALIAHSNASSSHPHAHSSYSPQSYYVTHPPPVVDYDEDYQEELQGDSQEDKLTTAMILLARAISQKFSSPTNNRLRKPKVRDAKYFREQMLLAVKDEAGSHLSNEENDFMLDSAYGEESLDELTASIMLMARLQPANGTTDIVPSYDEKAVSQVHNPSKAHEQVRHVKRKIIIHTTNDDQLDSNIMFDDPYVDNNGGMSTHDSIAHDENHEIRMLAYTVQREAEKQKTFE
uniref:Uncharacterized protein n=1 Tax=Tanacetum cinerariifolium TaxID=118510 RepID=A0A699JRX1_TANCI|nr:hypothetical protein [Tanacetum cinerariifolium]